MNDLPPSVLRLLGTPFALDTDDQDGIGCLQLVQRFVPDFKPVYTAPTDMDAAREEIRRFWREGILYRDDTSDVVLLKARDEIEPSHLGVAMNNGVLHSHPICGVIFHCWPRMQRLYPQHWRVRLNRGD